MCQGAEISMLDNYEGAQVLFLCMIPVCTRIKRTGCVAQQLSASGCVKHIEAQWSSVSDFQKVHTCMNTSNDSSHSNNKSFPDTIGPLVRTRKWRTTSCSVCRCARISRLQNQLHFWSAHVVWPKYILDVSRNENILWVVLEFILWNSSTFLGAWILPKIPWKSITLKLSQITFTCVHMSRSKNTRTCFSYPQISITSTLISFPHILRCPWPKGYKTLLCVNIFKL